MCTCGSGHQFGGHDGAVAADHHDGGGATAGQPCTGGFG